MEWVLVPRDAVQRLVAGFEHVSGIARQWEPDYSSGADRAKWARATEACADVVKLLQAAPQVEPVAQWRPIESAPKDGAEFLGYRRGQMATAYRIPREDCEMWYFGGQSGAHDAWPWIRPTHWMPLPAAPLQPGESK